MTGTRSARTRKAEATSALRLAQGQGLHSALQDLLEEELEEVRTELETAADAIAMWRTQGRAMELRQLLAAITPRVSGRRGEG